MTPQTVTITTARGETFTLNFDGPVFVEVSDPTPQSTASFSIGDNVEWTDKHGETLIGVVTDIFGHALQIGNGKIIWDHDARKPQRTAPKFKTGDVVYWEDLIGDRFYGRVTGHDGESVLFERLTTFSPKAAPICGIARMHQNNLHHDYRTVAGGGWRKCEVGKLYKTQGGGQWRFHGGVHDEKGYPIHYASPILIEELP